MRTPYFSSSNNLTYPVLIAISNLVCSITDGLHEHVKKEIYANQGEILFCTGRVLACPIVITDLRRFVTVGAS